MKIYWILHNAVRRFNEFEKKFVTEVILDIQCEPIDASKYQGKYLLQGQSETELSTPKDREPYVLYITQITADQVDQMAQGFLTYAPGLCPTIAQAESMLGVDFQWVQGLVDGYISAYSSEVL
jgi:hypothetical protein